MSKDPQNWKSETWEYIHGLMDETKVQKALREFTAGMEEAEMQISPVQASLMQMLVRATGTTRIIEVGVFTGYSSLSMALALPEAGRIIACDISKEWTDIARKYWEAAGQEKKINLRLGPASETLHSLIRSGNANSFDMAFVDADKLNYDAYYEYCLALLKPGGLLLIDNTLWSGRVADLSVKDADTVSIRSLNLKIQKDQRVHSALIPVADGLTFVYKKSLS